MYNIIDYLKQYRNLSLDDVHWNIIDNLMCAILVYLPLKSLKETIRIDNVSSSLTKNKEACTKSIMVSSAFDILNLIKNSERYKTLKICNFTSIKNNETQFAAATFRINKETIISFKGTDHSLIGWIENFRLSYEYPTYTHKLAINYLKENIKILKDTSIHLVGHSKGGNLAIVSAMESTSFIMKNIKTICNFDGPGLRKIEFESLKYKSISSKIVNVIPTGSVIGVLLNNNDYQVVKTSSLAINEHYPISWNIFGEFFVPGVLSNVSNQLHENTTAGFEKLDYVKVKITFEKIFESFNKEYTANMKFSYKDLLLFFKNIKNVDPEISKYITNIVSCLLTLSSKD